MFTLWSDIDRAFFAYPWSNLLYNRHVQDPFERQEIFADNGRMNLMDKGEFFEFVAELPGLKDEDLDLTVHANTLTLSAKRKVDLPKDASVLLCERGDFEVQKSVSLPVNVDTGRVSAKLKDGVLRVNLYKAAENQPRKITVN